MNTIAKVEPASKLRRIPLAEITVDASVQQRVAGTSRQVVEEYATAMCAGDAFPPPIVFSNDGATCWVGDGFHRIAAYRRAYPDVQEIQCEVRCGGLEAAVLFACGANASHGLRRSNEDKRKAVRTLLESEKWAHWSDREIARQCHVSHGFVSKLRSEHLETFTDGGRGEEQAASPPPAPETASTNAPVAPPSRQRTANRGGKSYSMRTAGIGVARATPGRPKNAGPKPLLSSLSWSIAPKPDRIKFVSAVGGHEIVEALKSIEPGFSILNWAWKGATQAERQTFAEEHHKEISWLAKTPGPTDAVEPLPNLTPADGLRELKPDGDPLEIPTFLRRGKAQSHDQSSDQVVDAAMSDIAQPPNASAAASGPPCPSRCSRLTRGPARQR